MRKFVFFFTFSLFINACGPAQQNHEIHTGAEQTGKYLELIQGKRVGIVANHTSLVHNTHLVDSLLSLSEKGLNFTVKKVFAPEHGFRGNYGAGALINDEKDEETGLPIVSLYGNNRKPQTSQLEDLDVVLFDIQDVGVRFYTYISTMHYMMEACAEQGIPMIVLDRPNPNAMYIDGPVLDTAFMSFVGMHTIPVVYGMTIGELSLMINGEGWLKDTVKCDLTVIKCANYRHDMEYILPVVPSPNLPNQHAIKIYPSTCFFEGTVISEGRGTYNPFEVYGHPDLPGSYTFIPKSIKGMSLYPKLQDQECYGEDLRNFVPEKGWKQLELGWIIDAYNKFPVKDSFFTDYFNTLAGTDNLRIQIESGYTENKIRETWQKELEEFKVRREEYLLYH